MGLSELTLSPRLVKLTPRSGISIRRTLPHRSIRTIGAWCFVDHYGPTDQANAMSVAAHPHTGLQTVSWLFSGEIQHRDSLGTIQIIKPGELNLMTSGLGIAHSELSVNKDIQLHGVQLWVVLPEKDRNIAPAFAHHSDLPTFDLDSMTVRLIMGELLGHESSAKTFTPLVGAELLFRDKSKVELSLNKDFEYGFLIDSGSVEINGELVAEGNLHYIPPGSEVVSISASKNSRIMLLGGLRFEEPIVMWWNFIGRSHDEIVEMRNAWESGSQRFANFKDQLDGRIPAPEMPNIRLTPRSNSVLFQR
ncbi:MAG: pirin family protein [Actinobacteria bacterium]|nr:pirin family protein [Actinomycetota bacterium]